MRPIVAFIKFVHHVQEILDISQVFSWLVILSSDPVSVGVGSNCRDVPHNAINLLIANLDVLVDGFSNKGWILLRVDC